MRIALPLAACLLLGLAACAQPSPDESGPGLLEIASPHPVAETMDRLENAAKERGFRIFARLDHAAGAASIGQELRPTQLLIFGNPQGGTPLMQNAQTIAIDLPLKALVYEDADGNVRIAFNDPAFLVRRHGLANGGQIVERMAGMLEGLATEATR